MSSASRKAAILRLQAIERQARQARELAESLPEWWEMPTFITSNIANADRAAGHVFRQLAEEQEKSK